MNILGIETSCDETAAAVVEDGTRILSNVIASQTEFHEKYGGVVPEIASRKHLELLNPVIDESLRVAALKLDDIGAVAVTVGPGLVGALLIGLAAAKALSYVLEIPLIGVNHLEAHLHAGFLEHPEVEPPLVSLIVSGGHTILAFVDENETIEVLGSTLDDAAGEAFDKIARFLDLGYPGGPIIDELAKQGDESAIRFPRAMMDRKNYDFSLSGLKTAVINYVKAEKKAGRNPDVKDIAAGFQAAMIDVQVEKTLAAARDKGVDTILLAGGVASNSSLRDKMTAKASETGINVLYPSPDLCTDNGAMIASLAFSYIDAGKTLGLDANVNENLFL